MTTSPDYPSLYQEMRTLWCGYKDRVDRSTRGELKRSPAQIERYRQVCAAIAATGAELKIIAANQASYEAWKAGLPKAGVRE